jgi:hypothetical protein
MSYGLTARIPEPFTPAVVDRVRAALKEQGFGVLTEIDIKATLREKLGRGGGRVNWAPVTRRWPSGARRDPRSGCCGSKWSCAPTVQPRRWCRPSIHR